MGRPGFGERHPHLVAQLEKLPALAVRRTAWIGGTVPLEIRAYRELDPPDELVTSVRCIVRVGEHWILYSNEDGVHPWPGGRRLPGEALVDTAFREVQEETGWRLEPSSIRQLGWLHLRHLGPRPNLEYPYPDFLQAVLTASAKERDCAPDAAWTDVDGHEQASSLVGTDAALAQIAGDPTAWL